MNFNMEGLFEFFNDGIFTSILLNIYNKMPVGYPKDYIGNFLLTISDIYIYEFSKFNFIDDSTIKKQNKELLREIRQNTLKLNCKSDSNHFKKRVTEMGINFNLYTYDCVITYNRFGFLDTNFRTWDYYHEGVESKKFFYDLIYNCDLWLKQLLKVKDHNIYEEIINLLDSKLCIYIDIIKKSNIKVTSFSSKKLFEKEILTENQKGFVLNSYGFIKSILFIEKIFGKSGIKIQIGNIEFDSDMFFAKLKAMAIRLIWDNFKDEKSEIWQKFEKRVNSFIPSEFWKITGNIRKNIHYKDYQPISNEELMYAIKYQNLYLKEFVDIVEKAMNFKISLLDRFSTRILKTIGKSIDKN